MSEKPNKTLSDYQEVSRDWLLGRPFAANFDEMGVGKSGPAFITGWERHLETGLPVLWTGPAYSLPPMAKEIIDFLPDAKVVIANGTGFDNRMEALQSDATFILTSYENWSAKWTGKDHPLSGQYKYKVLSERKWAACIWDEAHRLRGRNSQTTKHVFDLRKARASNLTTPLYVLTGTPMPNNPGDLYALLHLYDKKRFKSYWNFVGTYCYVTQTPWATTVGQLRPGMEEEFQAILEEFAIRRTLKDIPSLATLEHITQDYMVDLPVSVKKTFADARREYIIEHPDLENSEFVNGGGALYSKLRQMATNPPTKEKPKIDFLKDFLEDHFGPVVVYVHYKDSARAVVESLKTTKRPITLITGEVTPTKRMTLVDEWKTQSNGILVATIQSLKESVSLIHARDVVFLEASELPSDTDQAVARLKRRGQTELVRVHWVWARQTPDVAIRRAVKERTEGLKRALISWLQETD